LTVDNVWFLYSPDGAIYVVSQSKVKLKKVNKFILFIHFNTSVSYW
jgi:hypothetical protein